MTKNYIKGAYMDKDRTRKQEEREQEEEDDVGGVINFEQIFDYEAEAVGRQLYNDIDGVDCNCVLSDLGDPWFGWYW